MSSLALQQWLTRRAKHLAEIEAAHRGVGGSGRGRRFRTEQINHAYTMLLSSQFQGFCRDLHSESANAILAHARSAAFRSILGPALKQGLKLSAGNPNPGNIGSDFGRFGLLLWTEAQSLNRRTVEWK